MNSALPTATTRRWLIPASGSLADQELRAGRSPWLPMIHLVWSVWVFLTPLFSDGDYGFTPRWFALTALSYPLFLLLYLATVFAAPRAAYACALALVALCFALLPWYPSGLSYFVFGCVMLQPRRSGGLYRYLALVAVLNVTLVVWAAQIGYVWQALVWIPTVTAIIAVIVMVERANHERDAALKLSHEEVRRLAALAERERIGRDLHDLLGHTLSVIVLKSELASKLADHDPARAIGEIRDVERISRDALTEVRRAVRGYRARGFSGELAAGQAALAAAGVHLAADVSAEPLPPAVETTFALVLRESLTNVVRHAHATTCRTSLDVSDAGARLVIEDDGVGGAVKEGSGLAGMRERLEQMGGALIVSSGSGLRVEATLPLSRGSSSAGVLRT